MFYSPFENTKNTLGEMKQELEKEKLFFSEELTCACCKTRISDFVETGYVGCEECYKIFNKDIMQAVYNFHKSVKHTGKKPERVASKAKIEKEIDNLLKLQADAADNCDFLLAQSYKEKISELRRSL